MKCFEDFENMFDKYWFEKNECIVIPYTDIAKRYLPVLQKEIDVKCILDNNRHLNDTFHNSIRINFAPDYLNKRLNSKFLVSGYYNEIKSQLESYGYKEFEDFIDIRDFSRLWFWEKYNKLYVHETHMSITTYCTLNCKHCNMFMNHYRNIAKFHVEFARVTDDIDRFFSNVDFCYKFSILGGEPLLSPHFIKIIKYINDNYSNKIGTLDVITNGTVMLSESEISNLRGSNIFFSISDYSESVDYKEKLKQFISVLEKAGIAYHVNSELVWKDFYFPVSAQKATYTSVDEHMKWCDPVFRGLNDGKYYYCHLVWSACKAELFEEKESDFIRLKKETDMELKADILKFDMGYLLEESVSLCSQCGGCGVDNQGFVKAGIQDTVERKI